MEKRLLFNNENKNLESSGIFDDWPAGRGTYLNTSKNFVVWINEEDHLKIIYSTESLDLN